MGKVVKSQAAIDSLLSMGRYIADKSQSLETAIRVLQTIEDGILVLLVVHGAEDIEQKHRHLFK